MKKIWLHIVKAYINLGLFFYFRKILVYNTENVPKDQPVLFLSNHQNALLDALLIATKCGRFVYFLTRASVFKRSLVDSLLRSLQMLPVYRIRDGWTNISKNSPVFETCSELLHKNDGVVIFPEGSHSLNRTVRPLSKGFTRIIYETLQKYPLTNLQLVPVGVNFINAKEFGDSTSIYFGEPLNAKDYLPDFSNESVVELKEVIFQKITELTTHIPAESYDEVISELNKLDVDYLDPVAVNDCLASGTKNFKTVKPRTLFWFKPVLKILLKFLLIGPYLIWRGLIKPKIDEEEFISTFRFAVALTLVPLWLIALGIFLWFSAGWIISITFIAIVLLLDLLILKF